MTVSAPVESAFNVESFIKEYYDAWGGTDVDRVMSYYSEDVVVQIPGASMQGRQALREQFVRPFITAFAGNRHVVKNMIHGPGVVTVEFSFEAEHTGPFDGRAATGARIKLPGCGVYEYDSGKRQITSGRIYFDVGTLLQSITLVNEPKEAVEALQLNERNLRLIMNTIPTFAGSARPDGYCDFLNQRWLDYTGMTAEQAAGWGWGEAIHPDDRKGIVEYWQACLASGEQGEAEARLRRFDGAYRWCLIRASPLRDDSGKIVKWYGTTIDIEDRRRREEALRESEFSWRQIVDNIPGLVATTGARGEVEFLNRQTLEYFGRTSEELKDWALIDAVHPDDLPRVIEARKKSIEEGSVYDIEHRCRRADGVYRWFQVRGIPVRNAEGAVTAWYLLLTDTDDRKKAEEALRSSERNLRQITNAIPAYIHVLGTDGSVLYANQAVLDTGVTLDEALREDYRDRFFHPQDVERLRAERREALTRPVPFENEQRVLVNDDEYRWFLVRYNPVLDEQGKIDRWYSSAFDIEDRKRAEDALVRQAGVRADVSAAFSSQTPLGDILRGCTEAIVRHLDAAFARIWMLNKDENMLELHASAGMYTCLDGSYSRIPVGDLKVGAIAREKKAHLTNDVMNDPRVNDKNWAHSNGMVAFAGYPLLVEHRLIGVVGLFARHTLSESILDTLGSVADTIAQGVERKRAEEELRRSEAFLTEAQRVSKTGSFITDLLANEHHWSEELRRIFEFDPEATLTTDAIRAAFHPEDLPVYENAFKQAVAGDQDIDLTYRIVTQTGKIKHLHAVAHLLEKIAGRPVYIGAIQDVTESKLAEEALNRARAELAHVARLTTLDALTASIAHEVNQPISAAVTSAGACLRWLNREEPDVQRAREAAERIEQDGQRAADIIGHLRSFYKKDVTPHREMVSTNDLVDEMLLLLRSEAARHSVIMRTELAKDLPSVSATRVQLQQVLMNLMLNGMEAMSERGGELKIKTGCVGEDVMVSVSDTGAGVPSDKLDQIFNAFFTTKVGGTGMGLPISRTIIESHRGRLWATVNPGRGATFHFTLPTQSEVH